MKPHVDARSALHTWQAIGPLAARATAYFAPELPIFLGHFPGHPVVPGVHQLALLVALVRLATACPTWQVQAISRAKWLVPVHPGVELLVQVNWRPAGETLIVDGDCRLASQVAMTGRFTLARG